MSFAVNAAKPSLWSDLESLTKPRIGVMVVLTALVGYLLAGQVWFDGSVLLATLVGVFLTAASSGVLNQVLEVDSDRRMDRTAQRPLPAGRMRPRVALVLGLVPCTVGLLILSFAVNLLTAALTAGTLLAYLLVYTPLKQRTSLNTIVGAIPGAMPPVLGWTAATGQVGAGAIALFAILFLWQLPHFLAIAWIYRDDYEKGGHQMLPLADGDGRRTAGQMVIHSAALCVISILPYSFHMGGVWYLVGSALVGLFFLASTLMFWKAPSQRAARFVLGASLLYLPGVFGLLASGL